MKLFFGFIMLSFFYGLLTKHDRKKKVWVVLSFGLAICFGYYFLKMI